MRRISEVLRGSRVLTSRHRPSVNETLATVAATEEVSTSLEERITAAETDIDGLGSSIATLEDHVDDVEDASIAADAALDARIDVLEAAATGGGTSRQMSPLASRLIRPSRDLWVPPRPYVEPLASKLFTDRTDLLAWYAADYPMNQLTAGNPYTLTTAKDSGSSGGDSAPTSGSVERWLNMINGRPAFFWPTAGAPFNALVLPAKGALTSFWVIKPVSNGTFQNLYQGVTLGATTLYWDNTGPRYQVGTTANTTNSVSGTWKILFCFHYNTGLNPQARVIENDVQLYNGAAGAAGTPIPGTAGVPSNVTINMFKAGASFPWASYVAEWGFFATDKFATIASLRAYLRQKYATF